MSMRTLVSGLAFLISFSWLLVLVGALSGEELSRTTQLAACWGSMIGMFGLGLALRNLLP